MNHIMEAADKEFDKKAPVSAPVDVPKAEKTKTLEQASDLKTEEPVKPESKLT
jgi:hypothetical protein